MIKLNFLKQLVAKKYRQGGAMFGIESRTLKKQFGELFLVRMQSVASIETRGARSNYRQSGAMFGIDARVTMAVTAIAAFVVGVNQFTGIEKQNTRSAEIDLQLIQNAMERYYKDNYLVATDVQTLIDEKYLTFAQNDNIDPWGSTYAIKTFSQVENFEDYQLPVTYVTLIAHGKNGVQNISTPTNISQWNILEASSSDDVIRKFSTKETDREIAKTETAQLQAIKYALDRYIKQRQDEVATLCSSSSNHRNYSCDVNKDKVYDENEHLNNNFMPKEYDENKGSYHITQNPTYSTDNKFKSGYISAANPEYNMYQFLTILGVSTDYVMSPRRLVLHFDSNRYKATQAPYYADIWYDNEVGVF